MRTTAATMVRRVTYERQVKAAFPHIQKARAGGAKNAAEIAAYLNEKGVKAPTNDRWTVRALLRCLRRLKGLELDGGSLRPQDARATRRTTRNRNRHLRVNVFGSTAPLNPSKSPDQGKTLKKEGS